MGISASQARLLTITARLTSNEYESQQISNAKMRLATQSEQASSDYIAALNSKQIMFTTYDASGAAKTENLTPNAIYQYADMKNQYALVNSSGQMLISQSDAYNFKNSDNLDEFLAAYGIIKEYKTETLQQNVEKLAELNDDDHNYYNNWLSALKDSELATYERQTGVDGSGNPIIETLSSEDAYQFDKLQTKTAYDEAIAYYEDVKIKFAAGVVDEYMVESAMEKLSDAKANYTNCLNYDSWIKYQTAYELVNVGGAIENQETQVYKDVENYFEVLEEIVAEAEDLGTTMDDLYKYSDESKARWYTNLWYRLNGESSDKSSIGENAVNYSVLDSKLATSTQWLQDALSQGTISLEVASYKDATNLIPDESNPTSVILKGITWKSTVYSSCTDFTELDDDAAIAKAEAEYQKKNNEINAKDQKYENKIKTLDTEHTALQTEYESVQSAMNKNIERSFKAFS